MGSDPKFFDDIARVAGGAVNIISGLQQQARDEMRVRLEDMAARMDLVPRSDFEQVEAMVKKLRVEVEDLQRRLDAASGLAKREKSSIKEKPPSVGKSTTHKNKKSPTNRKKA